ncbi:MAG: excinuclease ABC subunit UvrC [Clostridia bacterium]|nr:excinuclease ABC subunit UvrC [Clostridia bacterium]
MTLKDKLFNLPDKPGVYLMKNSEGKIIYVGKAKILKNRVRQYFHESANHTPKVSAMVRNIADFEFIITATEREAFVLECNLIKEYRPHYNILLKDDKTYPFIKITNEEYPKILFTRRTENDGAEYFGPYTSSYFCREMIELTHRIFKIPMCKKHFPADFGKSRPCLYHSMGRCMGVCTGTVSSEEYKKAIKEASLFIKGKHKSLIDRLTEEMNEAAEKLHFERAASLRDKINSIRYVAERQNVTILKNADADVFAFAARDNDVAFEVMYIREGKMTGRDSFYFEGASGIDDALLMEDFLSQYYSRENTYIPKLVILASDTVDGELISELLTETKGVNVEVRKAVRGRYKELALMALKNAEKTLSDKREEQEKYRLKKNAAKELGELIGLPSVPSRIEAYDISHTAGSEAVGAMVVFTDGKYSKKDNRYFKIKSGAGGDDYASLKEVMERRFAHCLSEYEKLSKGEMDEDDAKFALLPDLILMDGGAGQLKIALQVMDEMGLSIPVFGMVKDDKHRTRGLVSKDGEIGISPTSSSFRLITAIQDEVHRVAIGYHRKASEKKMIKSPLLSLKGVGKATYEKLMREFKTVSKVKSATLDELIKAVGKTAGESIYAYYNKEDKDV